MTGRYPAGRSIPCVSLDNARLIRDNEGDRPEPEPVLADEPADITAVRLSLTIAYAMGTAS